MLHLRVESSIQWGKHLVFYSEACSSKQVFIFKAAEGSFRLKMPGAM